jgi:hypothetical protein
MAEENHPAELQSTHGIFQTIDGKPLKPAWQYAAEPLEH